MVSLRFSAICLGMCLAFSGHAQKKEIYHKGWIDFNKNGRRIFMKTLPSLWKSGWRTCFPK